MAKLCFPGGGGLGNLQSPLSRSSRGFPPFHGLEIWRHSVFLLPSGEILDSLLALDLFSFIIEPISFCFSPSKGKKGGALLGNDETICLALPHRIFDTSLIFY